MSNPELPWYQFSMRSLLVLTLFVAVLCSIGVCTDWSIAAVVAVGGVAGGFITRTRSGLLHGMMYGVGFSGMAAAACVLLWFFVLSVLRLLPWQPTAAIKIAAVIGSAIGGFVGGLSVRRRSRQSR